MGEQSCIPQVHNRGYTMSKAKTVAIIVGAANIAKLIDSIKRSGKKLDADIHQAALSAAAHFLGDKATGGTNEGGDVFQINSLYKAMPKGSRHVALVAWLTKFAGVKANEEANKTETPFVKDANKVVDIAGGMAEPWFDMKPSKKPDEVVDVYGLLMAVLKKATKEDAQIEGVEIIEPLRAFIEAHAPEAEQTEDEKEALGQ